MLIAARGGRKVFEVSLGHEIAAKLSHTCNAPVDPDPIPASLPSEPMGPGIPAGSTAPAAHASLGPAAQVPPQDPLAKLQLFLLNAVGAPNRRDGRPVTAALTDTVECI